MTHAPAERAYRPPRPGYTPRQWPVNPPDPGPQRREPAANECCVCGKPLSARRLRACAARGDSPFCVPCAANVRASRRAEAARESAWQKQKTARHAAREQEWETWREERRQARVAAWVAERPGRTASDYPWDGVVLGRR